MQQLVARWKLIQKEDKNRGIRFFTKSATSRKNAGYPSEDVRTRILYSFHNAALQPEEDETKRAIRHIYYWLLTAKYICAYIQGYLPCVCYKHNSEQRKAPFPPRKTSSGSTVPYVNSDQTLMLWNRTARRGHATNISSPSRWVKNYPFPAVPTKAVVDCFYQQNTVLLKTIISDNDP